MKIAAIVPCYKSKKQVLDVLRAIGPIVSMIFVIDDKCPQQTGQFVEENFDDPRLKVIFHQKNLGVGGAVITGYYAVLEAEYDIAVKIDSDGQMDPALIPIFVQSIIEGHADYTKGNRFFSPKHVTTMPIQRLIGNAGLSFMTKFSSGYWSNFDPTNGYTAIHRTALELLDLEKLEKRYFFESDILMRLNTIRAVVQDIPMQAVYKDEESGLSLFTEIIPFAWKNFRNFNKRVFYNYFLRNFSIASVNLIFGTILFLSGVILGASFWINSLITHVVTTAGSAALVVVLLIIGFQLLINFLSFDFSHEPTTSLQKTMDYNFQSTSLL